VLEQFAIQPECWNSSLYSRSVGTVGYTAGVLEQLAIQPALYQVCVCIRITHKTNDALCMPE
jgi:hypothetical protein